jgi:hypothetical protein
VRGRVVCRGTHDELGGVQWIIVRDGHGVEHYARLSLGDVPPRLGRTTDLLPGGPATRVLSVGRGEERGL